MFGGPLARFLVATGVFMTLSAQAWAQSQGAGQVPEPFDAEPHPAPVQQAPASGLSSPDPAERIHAIRYYASHGPAAPVDALIQVLYTDPDPSVRGWAARAMVEIRTPTALGALQQSAAQDPNERVRALSAQLLARVSAAPAGQPQQVVYQQPPAPPRRGLGLIISGWSIFGGVYLVNTIVGASMISVDADFGWSFLVPVAGPMIFGSYLWSEARDYDIGRGVVAFLGVLAWLDGLIQAAGVTMAIVGHVQRARSGRQAEQARSAPRIALSFSGPGGNPGLSLGGVF